MISSNCELLKTTKDFLNLNRSVNTKTQSADDF